jgi:hypothetical protein
VSLRVVVIGLLAATLCACGQGEADDAWKGDAPKVAADPAAEAGYLKPPALTAIEPGLGGGALLRGTAAAGAMVRLGSPTGQALTTTADPAGLWSLPLPPSPDVRLFSTSMMVGGRMVQSQGYLVVTPDGRAVQLRSGASAEPVGLASDPPRLLTLDYDSDGAATIGGVARAGTGVSLRIDRAARGAGKSDGRGRFHMVIDRPLSGGQHLFEVSGETGEQRMIIPLSMAGDLTSVYRATPVGPHWRIDWVTPGGGIQTTMILGPGA